MTATRNRAGFWDEEVWANIDAAVTQAVGAIRLSQNVFPTVSLTGVTCVRADHFHPDKMTITEGRPSHTWSSRIQFSLTNGQVNSDPAGATAITLSKFSAKALALAEDMVILLGNDATLPPTVKIESGAESLGNGIVGLAKDFNYG